MSTVCSGRSHARGNRFVRPQIEREVLTAATITLQVCASVGSVTESEYSKA